LAAFSYESEDIYFHRLRNRGDTILFSGDVGYRDITFIIAVHRDSIHRQAESGISILDETLRVFKTQRVFR
jgi:hypothetical protein